MARKLKVIHEEGKRMFYFTFSTANPKFTGFLFLCLPLKTKKLKIILFGFILLAGDLLGECIVQRGLFSS